MGLFATNELGRYIVVIIWMALNIFLFVITWLDYGTSKKYTYLREVIKTGLPFARGAAMVLNFNCMLILLTMCRNVNSLIRSHCNCGFMAPVIRVLDKSITFHKYFAYTICFFTAVHVGAHCFNFENLIYSWSKSDSEIDGWLSQLDGPDHWVNPIREASSDTVTELFKSVPGLTGAVITLCLIVMVSSSTELIRRSYFEVFWYSHHLFIVFFVGLVAHGTGEVLRYQVNMDVHDPEYCRNHIDKNPNCTTLPVFEAPGAMTWKFVLVPMILYFLERCLRFYRSMQKVNISKVIKHPSRVVEIQMKKPGFVCEAGQYVFLQVPKISQLEWHPFTLTNAPEENYFSVHIRIAGDWTASLYEELGADTNDLRHTDQLPRIAVDGPFGTASSDVFKFDVVMCIGAGIGVTPFASILKSIWYRYNQDRDNLRVKKVYFYWICRETKAFEWFSDLLKHHEIQMAETNNPGFIQINIFLTGWDRVFAGRISIEDPAAERDPVTGLFARTYYGRPGWAKIFKEVADAHNETSVGVFFCGPSGLSHNLHKMCNQSSDEVKQVKFFYNKENF